MAASASPFLRYVFADPQVQIPRLARIRLQAFQHFLEARDRHIELAGQDGGVAQRQHQVETLRAGRNLLRAAVHGLSRILLCANGLRAGPQPSPSHHNARNVCRRDAPSYRFPLSEGPQTPSGKYFEKTFTEYWTNRSLIANLNSTQTASWR